MAKELLRLDLIDRSGGTQTRAALNQSTVDEYKEAMIEGAKFPPVIVFYDGNQHWLADGFHRVEASAKIGFTGIAADIRQGSKRDAILYSVGANAEHGLPRSLSDKRRAVETLLRDEEWRQWGDREIARIARVSTTMVKHLREEMGVEPEPGPRKAVRNGKEYTINTANIGRSKSQTEITVLPAALETSAIQASPDVELYTPEQKFATSPPDPKPPATKEEKAEKASKSAYGTIVGLFPSMSTDDLKCAIRAAQTILHARGVKAKIEFAASIQSSQEA